MPYCAVCYPQWKMSLPLHSQTGRTTTFLPGTGRGGFLLALQQAQPVGSQYCLNFCLPLINFLILSCHTVLTMKAFYVVLTSWFALQNAAQSMNF